MKGKMFFDFQGKWEIMLIEFMVVLDFIEASFGRAKIAVELYSVENLISDEKIFDIFLSSN